MKITSLKINNFRCFEDVELTFEQPVTFLLGPNHVGKSTVLDALCWAIVAVCRGTDAGGKGAEDLVRRGAAPDTMSVQVGVGKSSFTRTVTEGPRSKLSTTIESKHGIRRDAALVCLAWDAFLNMDPATAREILMSVLDIKVPLSLVKELAGADFAEIERLKFAGPEDLAAAYAHVYKERAAVARDLKTFGSTPPPDLTVYPPKLQQLSVQEAVEQQGIAKDQLAELRRQLEALVVQYAGPVSDNKKAELASTIEGLKARMKKWNDAVKALGDKPDPATLQEALTGAVTRHEAASATCQAIAAEIQPIQVDVASLKAALELLDLSGTGTKLCPTCRRGLTPALLKGIVGTITKELGEKQAALENKKKDYLAAQAALKAADPTSYSRALDRAADNLASWQSNSKTYHDELHTVAVALAVAEAEYIAMDDPGPTETIPEHQAVTETRGLIERGDLFLRRLGAYISDRGQYDVATKQIGAAKARHGALERLCELLEPKGKIATECIGGKLAAFEKTINGAIEKFGYTAGISLDPSFAIAVKHQDGPVIPLKLLSFSERLRLGFSIQAAFAKESGFGLIVADEVSLLDADGRLALLGLVNDVIADGVDQVIMAATITTPMDEFTTPENEGWEYVLIE